MIDKTTFRLTAPHVLRAEPDQETLAGSSSAIEVRTLYSAISPGTELAAYNGLPPLRETPAPYPRLVGYCNVGEVLAVPASVSNFAVGDVILSHASHRSHFALPPEQILAKVPAGADLPAVSTTYLFHLGYAAILKGEVRPYHNVAVIGLGTLGLTTASLAHRSGATVAGFSNHSGPDAHVAAFGLAKVSGKSAAAGEFDVVVTTSNSWADWRLALDLARRGGRIVVLGFPGRGEPPPDFNPLGSQWFYDKQLTITACGHTPSADVDAIDLRFTLKRNCAYLMGEIICGRLPAWQLIAEVRPAEELAEIYAALSVDRRQGRTVVLDWTASG